MKIRALCSEPFFSLFLYAKVNWEIENGHFKMSIFDLLKILCPKQKNEYFGVFSLALISIYYLCHKYENNN
jgi:hypothetical protein